MNTYAYVGSNNQTAICMYIHTYPHVQVLYASDQYKSARAVAKCVP